MNKSKMSSLTSGKIEPIKKLRNHSHLASRSSNRSMNKIIHKSSGKMTTQDGGEISGDEGSSKGDLKLATNKK